MDLTDDSTWNILALTESTDPSAHKYTIPKTTIAVKKPRVAKMRRCSPPNEKSNFWFSRLRNICIVPENVDYYTWHSEPYCRSHQAACWIPG